MSSGKVFDALGRERSAITPTVEFAKALVAAFLPGDSSLLLVTS